MHMTPLAMRGAVRDGIKYSTPLTGNLCLAFQVEKQGIANCEGEGAPGK